MEKRIGKIQEISVGFGGYQDAMLGLSVTLGSDKELWGVGDFKGSWGPDIKCDKHSKWTEEQRRDTHANTILFIGALLTDAKKQTLDQLRGVPVEVTFDGNTLKEWRVLTEAI
jgi:hypothetical protein